MLDQVVRARPHSFEQHVTTPGLLLVEPIQGALGIKALASGSVSDGAQAELESVMQSLWQPQRLLPPLQRPLAPFVETYLDHPGSPSVDRRMATHEQ